MCSTYLPTLPIHPMFYAFYTFALILRPRLLHFGSFPERKQVAPLVSSWLDYHKHAMRVLLVECNTLRRRSSRLIEASRISVPRFVRTDLVRGNRPDRTGKRRASSRREHDMAVAVQRSTSEWRLKKFNIIRYRN